MEIFKKASKKKLRFSTNRGVLSVEQLWDLSKDEIRQLVIKAREAAKKSSGEVNDSELSFLDAPAKTKATDDELRFEILKDIYLTKNINEVEIIPDGDNNTRIEFAKAAMQSLLLTGNNSYEWIAEHSFIIADEMLKQYGNK